jgi:transposase
VNKNEQRLRVVKALLDGELDVERAAEILDLTIRQVYRLKAVAKKDGIEHVLHRGRGRIAPNKISLELWDNILFLARGQYRNLNDYELHEVLARKHKILISRESLRKKLRASGILPKRERNKAIAQYGGPASRRSSSGLSRD